MTNNYPAAHSPERESKRIHTEPPLAATTSHTVGGRLGRAMVLVVQETKNGERLRAIGEDETVARHTGINTTGVKVLVFAIAASMMSLVGGVYALRYPSIDPTVGFSNGWSFQVLIAALLGFGGIAGTAVGLAKIVFVVALVLLVASLIFGGMRGSFGRRL